MNTPVSFEIAKLLKEKGFDLSTERFYPKPKCKLFGIDEHGSCYPIVNKTQTYFIGKAAVLKEENSYLAPTIAEVIMWLYEKHGIFIQPFTIGEEGKMKFYIKLIVNDNGWIKIKHQISTIYNSPTKAYEAAIEYTLNNLI